MLSVFFTIFPLMVCAFWTAIYLLDWRCNSPAKHMLTLFMVVSTLLYLCHTIFFNPCASVLTRSIADCVYAFCNLAVFPLFYLYICRLTECRPVSKREWAILTPAFAIALWALLQTILWPDNRVLFDVRIIVTRVLFVLQLVPVCYFGWKKLRDFDLKISNEYSAIERRSVDDIRHLMIVLIVAGLISSVANYIGREWFNENFAMLALPSTLFGLLLFTVGYVADRQNFDADTFCCDASSDVEGCIDRASVDEVDLDEANTMQSEKSLTLASMFDELMESHQLYLQPDLRITQVAAMLGVGRTTLSKTINQEKGASFNDYINALRVEHAQRLMIDNSHTNKFSLQYISELSGFSSEVSFYRAFRRHTSLTPRQWALRNTVTETNNDN